MSFTALTAPKSKVVLLVDLKCFPQSLFCSGAAHSPADEGPVNLRFKLHCGPGGELHTNFSLSL